MRTRPRYRGAAAVTVTIACALLSVSPAPGGVPNRPPDSIEELLRWYPSRDTNATAHEMESLSAELGIYLWMRSAATPPEATAPKFQAAAGGFERIRSALEKYLQDEEQAVGRAVAPPPNAVGEYLDSHAAVLAAIRRRLSHGELPLWERRLERMNEAPIPNLLGHLKLQRVLMADALARYAAGDPATADQDLEASWALNTALSGEPTMITQLIAISAARTQTGAVRLMDRTFPAWQNRLVAADYRRPMLAAMRVEAWSWKMAPHPWYGAFPEPTGAFAPFQKLWIDLVLSPYERRMMSEAGSAWLKAVDRTEAAGPLCDVDLEKLQSELNGSLPVWNRIGAEVVKTFSSTLTRVARIEVDAELTGKILDLRAARDRDGRWPAGLRGLTASAACPSRQWVYSVSEPQVSIALDPPASWPNQLGIILPTRWESGPGPATTHQP